MNASSRVKLEPGAHAVNYPRMVQRKVVHTEAASAPDRAERLDISQHDRWRGLALRRPLLKK